MDYLSTGVIDNIVAEAARQLERGDDPQEVQRIMSRRFRALMHEMLAPLQDEEIRSMTTLRIMIDLTAENIEAM